MGAFGLHLCEAAVHKQFCSCDEACVIGGGAHAVGSLQRGAKRRLFARRNFPEHLNASRFGPNSADLRHLTARQSSIL